LSKGQKSKKHTSKQLLSKGQKSKKHTSKQLLSKGQKLKKHTKGKKQTKKSLKGGVLENINIDSLDFIYMKCYDGDRLKNSYELHEAIFTPNREAYTIKNLKEAFLKENNDGKMVEMRRICAAIKKMIETERRDDSNIGPSTKNPTRREERRRDLEDYFDNIIVQLGTD